MDNARPAPAAKPHEVVAKPTTSRVVLIVAAVLVFVLAIVGVLLLFNAGPPAIRLIGLLMIAPGLVLAAMAMLHRSPTLEERLSGWTNPRLEFSSWPPALGEPITVIYRRRPLRRSAALGPTGPLEVEARLLCREWVRYTVGTETRTDTEDVFDLRWREPAGPAVDGSGEIEARFELAVPIHAGAPTIELDDNRVEWRLEHELSRPHGKRTETKIVLPVRPFIDGNAVLGEGSRGAPT